MKGHHSDDPEIKHLTLHYFHENIRRRESIWLLKINNLDTIEWKNQLPIVVHMILIGIAVILIGWTYSELFDGYFRSILISSTVVCKDSDITWTLAEHMITERTTIEIGSRRVRPNQINLKT